MCGINSHTTTVIRGRSLILEGSSLNHGNVRQRTMEVITSFHYARTHSKTTRGVLTPFWIGAQGG